jgi:hypothetical protein
MNPLHVGGGYHWKALDKSYNFASDHMAIKGLHVKLWALKVVGVPIMKILGLPLWSPGTKKKSIWMWPLWRGEEYTIREKVVASPKSGPW